MKDIKHFRNTDFRIRDYAIYFSSTAFDSAFFTQPASLAYQYKKKLVGVFRIDLLARHLLEHAACTVGNLLVLVATESVPGFLLDEIETCKAGIC